MCDVIVDVWNVQLMVLNVQKDLPSTVCGGEQWEPAQESATETT